MEVYVAEQIAKLKRLIADLERLRVGKIFAPALIASPVLDNWRHGFRKVSCLEGVVEGHPSLPDGHVVSTSEIWAHFHDDEEHFVRTLNRWYRLGARGNIVDAPAAGWLSFGGRRG